MFRLSSQSVNNLYGNSSNSFAFPSRTVPTSQPCVAWEATGAENSYALSRTIVASNEVVCHSGRNGLVAHDLSSGNRLWRKDGLPGSAIRGVYLAGVIRDEFVAAGVIERNDNLVVFGYSTDGSVTTRTTVRESDDPLYIGDVQVSGDIVYTASRDSEEDNFYLTALNWRSGEKVWENTLGPSGLSIEDIGVQGDTVVLATDEATEGLDNIWALSRATGEVLWSKSVPIGEALPVLDDENLYLPINAYDMPSVENQVRALDLRAGESKWRFELLNPPRSGVATDGERVYVAADGRVWRVNPESGRAEWRYKPDSGPDIGDDRETIPIVCRETLLLGSRAYDAPAPMVRAIDKETGRLNWSFSTPGTGVTSPIPINGVLYSQIIDKGTEEDTVETSVYAFA